MDPRSGRHIHFVLDPRSTAWDDLPLLDEGAIAAQPARFQGGRNSWIAQTFLRLRDPLAARGWKVTTGPTFVPGTVSIVHRDDANRFATDAATSFLLVVRADRAPVHACDLAICQNGLSLMPHERFIPLWPQPGLRPRDTSRGTRLEKLAYLGRTGSMPKWFGEEAFHAALARLGVRFEVREQDWHRCEEVDAVLASRVEAAAVLDTKPATKIYNGWLAGIPVLAAPEPAYREARRRALDFLEVRDSADVIRAVRLLHDHPDVYAAMVANGRVRASEYGIEATRARWLSLFDDEIGPAISRAARGSRPGWYLQAMLRQRGASRMHKWAVARWRASV